MRMRITQQFHKSPYHCPRSFLASTTTHTCFAFVSSIHRFEDLSIWIQQPPPGSENQNHRSMPANKQLYHQVGCPAYIQINEHGQRHLGGSTLALARNAQAVLQNTKATSKRSDVCLRLMTRSIFIQSRDPCCCRVRKQGVSVWFPPAFGHKAHICSSTWPTLLRITKTENAKSK